MTMRAIIYFPLAVLAVCGALLLKWFIDKVEDKIMNKSEPRAEGWQSPLLAKKSHYFRDGRSLCSRWFTRSEQWDDAPKRPDCKVCWQKRALEQSPPPQSHEDA